jgi:hypothetical protein
MRARGRRPVARCRGRGGGGGAGGGPEPPNVLGTPLKFVIPCPIILLPTATSVLRYFRVYKQCVRPTVVRLTSSTQSRPSLPFCGTLVISRQEELISSAPYKTRWDQQSKKKKGGGNSRCRQCRRVDRWSLFGSSSAFVLLTCQTLTWLLSTATGLYVYKGWVMGSVPHSLLTHVNIFS